MKTDINNKQLTLRFGRQTAWDIELPTSSVDFVDPRIDPIQDLETEIAEALANPIGFPSMDQAVVPGDSLVFAAEGTVPALPQVLAGVIAFYHTCGTPLASMRIVLAGSLPKQAEMIAEVVEARFGEKIPVEIHDPDNPDAIAYVAADEAAEAIYVNRCVVDADVVVPIMCGRAPGGLDDLGSYSLFPLLSDRTTRGKFYTLRSLDNPESHSRLNELADQAAWWTGFLTTIQVIPAGDDRVGAVLAGTTAAVYQACQEKMNEAWVTPALASDLTVALLAGDEVQQSWLGIARAIHAALRCTREGGSLVVCTDAELLLGSALHRLAESNLASGESEAATEPVDAADDAITAALIAQAAADRHVYLVSSLQRELVESLGMGVIEDATELSRLINRATACVILGSAQFRSVGSLAG